MADGTGKKVRKPRPEKIPSRDALDPGDLIEFSTTVEVKPKRSGSVWIKGGGTTSVRPSESALEARTRLEEFVMEGVNAQVLALLSE